MPERALFRRPNTHITLFLTHAHTHTHPPSVTFPVHTSFFIPACILNESRRRPLRCHAFVGVIIERVLDWLDRVCYCRALLKLWGLWLGGWGMEDPFPINRDREIFKLLQSKSLAMGMNSMQAATTAINTFSLHLSSSLLCCRYARQRIGFLLWTMSANGFAHTHTHTEEYVKLKHLRVLGMDREYKINQPAWAIAQQLAPQLCLGSSLGVRPIRRKWY